MKFGIDRLVAEPALRAPLHGRRVALLAHPASVTEDLTHSLDALAGCGDVKITAAFGPQHGLRGEKQDNMVESAHFKDPVHGIPVFSLYGNVRKPTGEMMDTFDVILVDLQDLGCRIYTYITTLRYLLEAASRLGKAVWVLDRPNPVGRVIEGLTLRSGWHSFVGAGPLPMRHGLTLGELASWFVELLKLDVEYRIIEMQDWRPDAAPAFGWPLGARAWINPSPNASNLWMARHHSAAGTVRRARHRYDTRDEGNVLACTAVATRLPPAPLRLRAYLSQTCRQALLRGTDPHRRSQLRSRSVQALASPGARVQGDSPFVSGLSALARFRL